MRVLAILLASFVLVSCNEDTPTCNEDFSQDYRNLQDDFKSFYLEGTLSKSDFVTSLEEFKENHGTEGCIDTSSKAYVDTSDVDDYLVALENTVKLIPKVVYGEDNRVEINDIKNPVHRELARGTAAMFPPTSIGSNLEVKGSTLGQRKQLCPDERFRDQQTPASCSGFLLGDDVIVTAGHCIENDFDCEYYKWVFDYTEGVKKLKSDNIYGCKEIIKRENYDPTGLDFAVIRLDRKVKGRSPLDYRKSGKLGPGEDVFVIGHPSGLPGKYADGAKVRGRGSDFWFTTNLDTFAGNSGSAVFNEKTGKVEGILVRGATDYYQDTVDNCYRVKVCESNACSGEDVVRITKVEGLDQSFSYDELIAGLFFDRTFDIEALGDRVLWAASEGSKEIYGAGFFDKCYLTDGKENFFDDCGEVDAIKDFLNTYF